MPLDIDTVDGTPPRQTMDDERDWAAIRLYSVAAALHTKACVDKVADGCGCCCFTCLEICDALNPNRKATIRQTNAAAQGRTTTDGNRACGNCCSDTIKFCLRSPCKFGGCLFGLCVVIANQRDKKDAVCGLQKDAIDARTSEVSSMCFPWKG